MDNIRIINDARYGGPPHLKTISRQQHSLPLPQIIDAESSLRTIHPYTNNFNAQLAALEAARNCLAIS